MKNKTLNQKILSAVRDLIAEQTEQKPDNKKAEPKKPEPKKAADKKSDDKKPEREGSSKIVTKGAFGSGGFKQIFSATKSRAEADSKALMRDLGIRSASGNSDIKKAESVIAQAVKSNELMSLAFAGPRQIKAKGKDAVVFGRKSSDLSVRDATKYIYLTLLGAENAGFLKFEKGVKFLSKNDVSAPTIIEL